jgi:hypothetical protein
VASGANVKQVQVLHELNDSLRKFSQELSDSLKSVLSEINRTLDYLAGREKHWREEVCRCQADLRRAELAYAACMAQIYDDDHKPTCHSEAAAVAEAQRQLAKAEAELANVLSWRRKVDSKITAYIGEATRLQRAVNSTLPQASGFLSAKSGDLQDYRLVQPPSEIRVIGQRGAAYKHAKQEMMLNALDDPRVGRDIKGWIRNEMRRVQTGQATRMRMPGISRASPYVPTMDAGHRIHDVHHWSNLRFEDVKINRARYHHALRLGLSDRIR